MKNQGLDAARGVFSSLPSLSPQQARVLLTLEYERMEHRPVVHVLRHGGRVALHVGADHRTNAAAFDGGRSWSRRSPRRTAGPGGATLHPVVAYRSMKAPDAQGLATKWQCGVRRGWHSWHGPTPADQAPGPAPTAAYPAATDEPGVARLLGSPGGATMVLPSEGLYRQLPVGSSDRVIVPVPGSKQVDIELPAVDSKAVAERLETLVDRVEPAVGGCVGAGSFTGAGCVAGTAHAAVVGLP